MKTLTKAFVMLALSVLVLPVIASAQTVSGSSLQAQIAALEAELAVLQQQLASQGGGSSWCYNFSTNLSIGMSGADVTALQTALQKDGESVSVTGTFDDQTASAVTGFQEKYASVILAPSGLQYGTGYVGKGTRAELNSMFGCGGGTTTAPTIFTNGQLGATLGQPYVADFYIGYVVPSINSPVPGGGTVGCTGYLPIGGTLHTTCWSNAPGSYTFSTNGTLPPGLTLRNVIEPPPMIPAGVSGGQPAPIIPVPNATQLSGTPSQVGSYPFTMVATNASSGATISQNFTITVASGGTTGAPYIQSISPASGPVGSSVTITGSGFGSAPVVEFNGMVAASDVPTNGSSVTFTVPSSMAPYCAAGDMCSMLMALVTPQTYQVTVLANGATSNAAQFTVTSGTGVVTSTQSLLPIQISQPTAGMQWNAGAQGSVQWSAAVPWNEPGIGVAYPGTFTIQLSAPGQSPLTLSSGWASSFMTSEGDIYSQFTSDFTLPSSLASGPYTVTVTQYLNGQQTSASVNVNVVGATSVGPSITMVSPNGGEQWPLGSTQTIQWNSTGNIGQVEINLVPVSQGGTPRAITQWPISNTGSYSWSIPNCTASNPCSSNFQIGTGSYTIQVTGVMTPASVVGQSAAPFNIVPAVTVPVTNNTISVGENSGLANGSVIAGSANVKIGSYTLSNPSSENVLVSSLGIMDGLNAASLHNLHLVVNGAQFGSTQATLVNNGASIFGGYGSVAIPPHGVMTLDVYADVLSSVSAGSTNTTSFLNCTAVGQTSNASYSCGTQTGQTMTLTTSAGLSVSLNTAVGNQSVPANSAGVRIGSYNLLASSAEAVHLYTITLGVGSGVSLKNLTLYLNGVQVGTTVNNVSATNNFASNITIPAGATETLDIRADVSSAGSMSPATTFAGCSGTGATSNAFVTCGTVSGQGLTVTGSNIGVTQNSALASGSILAGSVATKIGSYVLTNPSTETVLVNTIGVQAGQNAGLLQNLKLSIGGTLFGTTQTTLTNNGMYVFSSGYPFVSIQPNGSLTVDVLADVSGAAPAGSANGTTFTSCVATGQISNSAYTCTSAPGQAMTIVTQAQ